MSNSKKTPLKERLRQMLRRLATESATPPQVGLAVGVGVLIGTTPLYGLHGILSIGVATALKLNRVITLAASNYSIPPLYPFIVYGSVQIGSMLTTGNPVDISLDSIAEMNAEQLSLLAAELGLAWALGAPVLGAMVGIVTGGTAYLGTRLYRGRRVATPLANEADAERGDDGRAAG